MAQPSRRTTRYPARMLAAIVVLLACSEDLDCANVGCAQPPVTFATDRQWPSGARAELCGRDRCVTVDIGTGSNPNSRDVSVFTDAPKIDKHWWRRDRYVGTTNVRVLAADGTVLASGIGRATQEVDCCAGQSVSFKHG